MAATSDDEIDFTLDDDDVSVREKDITARLARANAPDDLSASLRSIWLTVAEAPPPELVRSSYVAGGVKMTGTFLKPGLTDLHTYAFFLGLSITAGVLYVTCLNAGCKAKLRLPVEGSQVKFGNVLQHVKTCKGMSMIAQKHYGGPPAQNEDPHSLRPANLEAWPLVEHCERVNYDDLCNAAALLDPACFATYRSLGGNLSDAKNFFKAKLEKYAVRITPLGASQISLLNAAQLQAEIKTIRETNPKGIFQSVADNEEAIKEKIAAARVRFQNRGPDEDIIFGALAAQLDIEMALIKKLIDEESEQSRLGAKSKYGDPFDSDNKERYRMWPAHRDQMPLLFICSWCILASIPAASTENERIHSTAGRICTKLRSSLSAGSLERLTLGYYYMRDAAKRKATDYAAHLGIIDSNNIDIAQLDQMIHEDENFLET